MKLFAIITAGLMAAAGGAYYSSKAPHCSKESCCLASVASTGGCDAIAETCPDNFICCPGRVTAATAAKPASCCGPNEECCIAQAACCLTQAVATRQPIEITGCCDECVSPSRALIGAAKSVAAAN